MNKMSNNNIDSYTKDCVRIEFLCNGDDNSRRLLYAFFLFNPYETSLNIEKLGELNINEDKIAKFITHCCNNNFNYTTNTLNFLMLSIANQRISQKEIDINLNLSKPIPFIRKEFYQEYVNIYETIPFDLEKLTIIQNQIISDFKQRLLKHKISSKKINKPDNVPTVKQSQAHIKVLKPEYVLQSKYPNVVKTS